MSNPNLRLIVCGPGNEDGTWIEAETIEAFEEAAELASNVHALFGVPKTYAETFGPARMRQQQIIAALEADAPAKDVEHLDVWAWAVVIASVENRPVAVRQLGVSVPDPIDL